MGCSVSVGMIQGWCLQVLDCVLGLYIFFREEGFETTQIVTGHPEDIRMVAPCSTVIMSVL